MFFMATASVRTEINIGSASQIVPDAVCSDASELVARAPQNFKVPQRFCQKFNIVSPQRDTPRGFSVTIILDRLHRHA